MDPYALVTGNAPAFPGRSTQRLPQYTPASLPTRPAGTSGSTATSHSSPLARPGTVATRLLLLSDTHNVPLFAASDAEHAFKAPLPPADVVLHAGDLSNTGRYEQLRITFDMLASAPAPLKLVIAGNHDVTLDPTRGAAVAAYPGATPAQRASAVKERAWARELWTGAQAQAAGIVYLEEGVYRFALSNGAFFTIYASPYSLEYRNWAFMHRRDEDRWNPVTVTSVDQHTVAQPANPIPDFPAIDIVMTHGPAFQLLDRVVSHEHVGCPNLTRALARVRPRLHVFGHIHEDWGAMRVNWEHGTARYLRVPTGDDEHVIRKGYVELDVTGRQGKDERRQGDEQDEDSMHDGNGNGDGNGEIQWGTETLCVNAAIMNARFRPMNAPWLIDLLLPAANVDE